MMEMIKGFIILTIIGVSAMLLSTNMSYAGVNYSDYDYPNWVETEKWASSNLMRSDGVRINIPPEEIHKDFISGCVVFGVYSGWLKPECVEVIVDAKLKPIHEKLDWQNCMMGTVWDRDMTTKALETCGKKP